LNARFDTVAQQAPAALIAVRDVVEVIAIDVSVGAFVSNEDFRVSRPSRLTKKKLVTNERTWPMLHTQRVKHFLTEEVVPSSQSAHSEAPTGK
jgi:hypothetical protein